MKPKVIKKSAKRDMRVIKRGTASDAIGKLEPGQDVYILTYGQFSLIDALSVILDQTGPADVVMSSWTAGDAHLEEAAHMMEAMAIRDFRMIVDRSFKTRQPAYFRRMRELFGVYCVREIRSHAKFIVVTNERWSVVVRTSMNLNENPRFENIEISVDAAFAQFMLGVVDEIFATVPADESTTKMPEISDSPMPYRLVDAPIMEFERLKVPATSHVA